MKGDLNVQPRLTRVGMDPAKHLRHAPGDLGGEDHRGQFRERAARAIRDPEQT
jgi:hypothetical protein